MRGFSDDNRQELTLVLVLFVTWGVVFLDRMTQLYLSPYLVRDLGLSRGELGIIAAVTSISWALSSVLFGAISDRVGRRQVLIPMILAFSTICCLSGLARGYTDLLLLRALMGVAEGPCWSVLTALIGQSSPQEHRARNVSIVVSAGAVVGLFLGPMLATQVAEHFGWRYAFLSAGLPGYLAAFLVWRFVVEPPWADVEHMRDDRASFMQDIGLLLGNRNLLLCCLGASAYISFLLLQNLFAPLFIVSMAQQSATIAGILLGIAGIGNIFVGLASGLAADRFGHRPILVVLGLVSMLSPLALLWLPLYDHLPLLALILFCTQGGQGITAIVMVLVPAESVPPRLAATAIGLVNLCGELLGGALVPAVAGRLSETMGLALPLQIAMCAAAVIVIVALTIRRRSSTS